MKTALIAIVLAVLGYIAATPYLEVRQIRGAAEDRDAERLAESVDFPTLRRNMKEQLRFAVLDGANQAAAENPIAMIGVALGGVVLDGLVELWVTPAGVMQMMKGDRPDPGNDEEPAADSGDAREVLADARYRYTAWDRFVIEVPDEDHSVTKFVLRRQGMDWKLTNIILPVDET